MIARALVLWLTLGVGLASAQEPEPVRERDPDYLRAFVEESFFLAVGVVWYWIDKDKNSVDWDFDSWTQRFDRSAFRYDNNRFQVNWVFHPFAGSAYYGFARANELHAGWAFTYGFLTSFAWEWLLEFKERVSINDQIATPLGGMALGEFWTKLSRWLHVRGNTPARRAAAWTLGLGVRAHEAIDGDTPTRAERDAMHAEFRLRYGPTFLAYDDAPAWVHSVAFEGHIVEMPGWHRRGDMRRAFGDANFAALRARATRGPAGGGFELDADTLVAGLHVQSIGARGGASATVAAAIGYGYRRIGYDGFTDRVGVVHLPGFGFEGMLERGIARLRLSVRGHGDFASADVEETFGTWQAGNPDARTKTILEREGYFYGWGASGWGAVRLGIGPVELGFAASVGQWWSHDGLDRTQEEVDTDVEVWARRVELDAWTRVELPWGLHLEARYDERHRSETVGDVSRRRSGSRMRRIGFAVGLTR